MKKICAFFMLCVFATTVFALDQKAVEEKLGVKTKELNKTPLPGLFEVVTSDNHVFYMDESGNYLLEGSLVDLQKRTSLTQQTVDRVSKVDFKSLPLQNAIKWGSGKKKLVVFHDIDCPYCRKLHTELKKLKDVEIYNFLFNLSFHPDAYGKAKKVYCSKDPFKTMDAAMNGDNLSGLKECDTDLVDKNKKLAEEMGVTGTPHMVMENGVSLQGFMGAENIQQRLDQAGNK
jgi:thiol:disulfide interchange protein DsbC